MDLQKADTIFLIKGKIATENSLQQGYIHNMYIFLVPSLALTLFTTSVCLPTTCILKTAHRSHF